MVHVGYDGLGSLRRGCSLNTVGQIDTFCGVLPGSWTRAGVNYQPFFFFLTLTVQAWGLPSVAARTAVTPHTCPGVQLLGFGPFVLARAVALPSCRAFAMLVTEGRSMGPLQRSWYKSCAVWARWVVTPWHATMPTPKQEINAYR